MAIPFVAESAVAYGVVEQVSSLIRRVVAENPSKFTYHGTGTYLVGSDPVAVIDPGPDDDAHLEALLRAVDGSRVSHILVTHTHADHSPASRALADATDAVVFGYGPHPEGAVPTGEAAEEHGDTAFAPHVAVGAGDRIEGDGFTFECLHTPGHISNHVCYALDEEAALFSGDHVMGWSTTIIPPPHGHMGDYMASLRLLQPRHDRTYWPTHGPAITEPGPYVAALLEHRLQRERDILSTLRSGGHTVGDLVNALYHDVRAELHEAAGRTVESHLSHLAERGEVTAAGDGSWDLV